jgi:transcription termination factor 2
MGLGKTLEMICLILKHKELEAERGDQQADQDVSKTGKTALTKTNTTLIICPASLMSQWENEIKTKVKSGRLSVLVYHGTKERKVSKREMAQYDVIITTYGVILSEVKV